MSQRIHTKRHIEPSSSQNEPSSSQNEPSSSQNLPSSSSHNEPEYSETPKKGVDISSLKEKYKIRLPRTYKEPSVPQIVHFSEELESAIPETVDELQTGMLYSIFCIVSEMSIFSLNILPNFILFSENRKLREEIAELKRQSSQMEIDFEKKLEEKQENIEQMNSEIEFLANVNQQFGIENDQLTKNLDRFLKYRVPELSQSTISSISTRSSPCDSDAESEIIAKRPKSRKVKQRKIARTNKGKSRMSGRESEESTESDDEKNEKEARVCNSANIQNAVLHKFLIISYFLQNEMKAIIKTIDSEFCLDYSETFTSANNLSIRRKLIPELQKSLAPKYKPSIAQLTKWLNSLHKSRRATARMRNSGKISKDLRRQHANNRQNDV
jgi:hypothetical protein